jgi:methionyl-tRNA formyltransferase
LRIIFAGTPLNAAETLQALLDANHEVVGVLTRLDAPTGRSGTLTESPVASVANEHGLEILKSNRPDTKVAEWITSLKPELGVVVAYGSILRRNLLEIPQKGWLNVHYSLLPKYPGASPVQQTLLEGDSTTGVTVFQLDEGVDSGPILAQSMTQISSDATAGSLLEKLTAAGAELLVSTLEDLDTYIENKTLQEHEPTEPLTRKLTRASAKIGFDLPAHAIVNLVRAMNPEPVAWFELESQPVRVLEASIAQVSGMFPGVAVLVDGDLVVGASEKAVILRTVQPAGKRPMLGADWFRGLHRDSLSLT